MWMRSDDPVADFVRYDTERAKKEAEALAKLPCCSECGERLTEGDCYEFDNDLICSDCLFKNHYKSL